MSNSALPTSSSVPKAGGLCGYQHGNTPCLPEEGQTCCSINGFCGSTEAYCFVSNGCQYGCIDPVSFYATRAPTLSTSVIVISSPAASSPSTSPPPTTLATSPITSSAAHSATSTPSPIATKHGLQGKAKIGVAVGVSIGGTLVLFLLGFLLWCWIKWKKDAKDAKERETKRLAEAQERKRQAGILQQNGSEAPARTKTPLNVVFGSKKGVVENE
ncbi:hypothetical protein BGZ60DRAFT_425928 [Tricladium varicosporioides]|nr:hypothetical protein BGZ60DRAFT_425928 [Hymenoscyphus varicosporioides]